MKTPLEIQTVMAEELSRAISENAKLRDSNRTLLHTLQSVTAWVRTAGGDCITLDQIVREQMNIQNAMKAPKGWQQIEGGRES